MNSTVIDWQGVTYITYGLLNLADLIDILRKWQPYPSTTLTSLRVDFLPCIS